jgi:exonuclease SbcC
VRLHELRVTAFGPFADTVTVDFDDLSASGLFLLTGPTGAGKTSVLDAVSFALYGEVPGDRQSAKRLRSDQAEEGVAPQVALELTLSGRRFRIVRSPAWERPKKRGVGTTTEQASVRLSERRHGQWHQLSSRLDETGHLVTELVGMSFLQFCQVAMLPQGRFQAFLRARSEDRHRLLQQLFRTQRFEDIERWLRERRKALRQRSLRHQDAVAALLSRFSETADAPLPDEWELHDLTGHADAGALDTWAAGVRDAAASRATEAAESSREAAAAARDAGLALEQGRSLDQLQQVRAAAASAHRRLTDDAPEHARRTERLERARRASTVVPFAELADRQRRLAADATARADRERRRLADALDRADLLDPVLLEDLDGPADLSELDTVEREAADRAAGARALLPRERALASLRAELGATRERVAALEEVSEAVTAELDSLPPVTAEARRRLAAALDAERSLPGQRERVERLRRQVTAASEVLALESELTSAREQLLVAGEELQRHKEVWLALQEERINGMAAELAGVLAVGADCPVCGSHDHPRPAAPRPGAPDATAEKAARRLVDDAEALRHVHDEKVRDLTTRVALARELATGEPDAPAALADAEAAVDRLGGEAETVGELAAEVDRLEALSAELTGRQAATLRELLDACTAEAAQAAEAASITREVEAVLTDGAASCLDEVVQRADTVAEACRRLRDAWTELRRARAAEEESAARCDRAARDAGFPDAPTALAATLPDVELEALAAEVADHERLLGDLARQLDDPTLREACLLPTPDLAALEQAARDASAVHEQLLTRSAVAESCVGRLTALLTELCSALAAWAPVRAELDVATRVAGLAEGTSADNRLRMRLSAFVLAWRLSQVVDAANERLSRMSDHRYSLEHTGQRGAGETRGGLSLLARDDWSGESRDPATLSGGETFVVSLALALGLADVIAQEVGGADLDTLFVDEGFGSLDADTLDDVLGTLDTLREGGRVVGVVSHVAEMRDRIPAQLRVSKSRRGSSLVVAR